VTLVEFLLSCGGTGGAIELIRYGAARARAGADTATARAAADATKARAAADAQVSADATDRHEITGALTVNERLFGRVAALEERLDKEAASHAEAVRLERAAQAAERAACDERLRGLAAEVARLREQLEAQAEEITALRGDKEKLAREAKRLMDEYAERMREGRWGPR
jgi:DNA repair exonuclease SbcCD ATPase subunit